MWKQLKKKLPMKAEYTEDNDNFKVTIDDMEITEELVTFYLKKEDGETFNVSGNRKYIGVTPDEKGLLITGTHCWTLLLEK